MNLVDNNLSLPLHGDRISVREFTEQDLAPFATYRAIPAVAQYQSWSEYHLADAQRMFDSMKSVPFGTVEHWFQLAICLHDNETLVGDLAVHFIDEQQIEVGFTLAPQYQGQGYAKEALALLLNYLFSERKQHRVIAVTDSQNLNASRLLESLGFRREAHYVDNIFFKGAWGSEYQYALLNREWAQAAKG